MRTSRGFVIVCLAAAFLLLSIGSKPGENTDWPFTGGDRGASHYSPLAQIRTGNVKELGLAWSYDTGTHRGLEATPVIVQGTMYTTLSWSIVVALDAATGKQKWRFDPEVPRVFADRACCDVVNRGVAFDQGRVFSATLDGRLLALDAATGRLIWSVATTDPTKNYTITGAPRVAKGKVIIGNGGAEYGVRGYVTAYDAKTGRQAWRFYTVPGNPAGGFENDTMRKAAETWTGEWWKIGGGGTAWDAIEHDPDLDLVYVGTGNGSPWSRTLRSPQGGDNLFLASIVALRPDTGEYVWHYQTSPGDDWDYTATQPMILTDLTIGGKPRRVLLQAPKNGFFYVLDRATGGLISAEPFAKVTWASHVDKATGRPVETPEARYGAKPVRIAPGPAGAHNWQPMSYHPPTGLVFIPAQGNSSVYAADPEYDPARKRGWRTGIGFAPGSQIAAPALDKLTPDDPVASLLAWDPMAQKARWRVSHKTWLNGGVLSTAGGLVFQGRGDGYFTAYSAESGEKLWEVFTGNGIIAGPAAYEVNGRQYITVLAGFGGIGLLRGGSPGLYKTPGRIWTFALGAKGKMEPAVSQARPELSPIPPPTDALAIKAGARAYARLCGRCHGFGTVSTGLVADLRYSAPETFKLYRQIVWEGSFARLGMPGFSDALTVEEVDAIRDYVLAERAKLSR